MEHFQALKYKDILYKIYFNFGCYTTVSLTPQGFVMCILDRDLLTQYNSTGQKNILRGEAHLTLHMDVWKIITNATLADVKK